MKPIKKTVLNALVSLSSTSEEASIALTDYSSVNKSPTKITETLSHLQTEICELTLRLTEHEEVDQEQLEFLKQKFYNRLSKFQKNELPLRYNEEFFYPYNPQIRSALASTILRFCKENGIVPIVLWNTIADLGEMQ